MSLKDIMEANRIIQEKKHKEDADVVNDYMLEKHLDPYRNLISFWRMYPDKLVDFYCSLNPDNRFHLDFSQKIFLRCVMRHKRFYGVFTRGFSKSFLVVLAQMLRAILYPGIKEFVISPGKNQSAEILQAKVKEICDFIPAISKEIIWDTRGTNAKTQQTKDSVIYTFRNGSLLRNVYASENLRGQRFNCGIMEECVGLDQDDLNKIVIPTLNVDRNVAGVIDPNEVTNKSQTYITTAAYKNSFSYEKLIQLLVESIIKPEEVMILGGSWVTSVLEGRLAKNFVQELKTENTFNEATFEMEYGSVWTGDIEGAFFDSMKFDKSRVLNLAEKKFNYKIDGKTNDYYVLGVDVGRHGCTTEVVVIKVTWSPTGTPIKQIVNIYTYEAEHFGIQALNIKKLFQLYKCKCCVVDGNGLGTGLVDFLVTDQYDPDTKDTFYNFGVMNDPDGNYKKWETENTIYNAMYIMKANQVINSECYSYCQTQLLSGKLRFLIDESLAKIKLMEMEQGKQMTAVQRAAYLLPYNQTSILKAQMMNLVSNQDGVHIILKQSNTKILKDKFSALIYGLYYCKLQEDKKKKRSLGDLSQLMLFSHR